MASTKICSKICERCAMAKPSKANVCVNILRKYFCGVKSLMFELFADDDEARHQRF